MQINKETLIKSRLKFEFLIFKFIYENLSEFKMLTLEMSIDINKTFIWLDMENMVAFHALSQYVRQLIHFFFTV